jgi:hypothetical protein
LCITANFGVHVADGSEAEVPAADFNFRFWRKRRHPSDVWSFPILGAVCNVEEVERIYGAGHQSLQLLRHRNFLD